MHISKTHVADVYNLGIYEFAFYNSKHPEVKAVPASLELLASDFYAHNRDERTSFNNLISSKI